MPAVRVAADAGGVEGDGARDPAGDAAGPDAQGRVPAVREATGALAPAGTTRKVTPVALTSMVPSVFLVKENEPLSV